MKMFSKIVAIFFITLIFLGLLFEVLGFRINLTDSIPKGLYRITNTKTVKNSYVIFCPDNREAFQIARARNYINYGLYCGGYGYLMKKVVAVAGDKISVTNEGVFVNKVLVPYSKPKIKDGLNRNLPQWRIKNYLLKRGEIMTMSNQSD